MAQELHSNGFELFYYDSSKIGEVDFVIQNGVGIELLEIKSGKEYRKHKALDNVLNSKDYHIRQAYVLCTGNIESDGYITYIPVYLTYLVKEKELSKMIVDVDLGKLKN